MANLFSCVSCRKNMAGEGKIGGLAWGVCSHCGHDNSHGSETPSVDWETVCSRPVAENEREFGGIIQVDGLEVGIRGVDERTVARLQAHLESRREHGETTLATSLLVAGVLSRLPEGHGYVAVDDERNVLLVPQSDWGAEVPGTSCVEIRLGGEEATKS